MNTPEDGSGPAHDSVDAEQAALSESLGGFLIALLRRAFEVSERDAEWLVRETFIDHIQNEPAPDARAWILGAACKKANAYRQRRGLPAADEAAIERQAAATLSIRDAMESLPRRAREALRLRFEEKKTYTEIAEQLGLSVYAAKRFVAKALARLRGLLRGEEPRQP